ncbi:MAG: aspartate aminotransferase family protein [Pontimonas sp.]
MSKTAGTNERAFALDREHVFHSWSAQGALNPLVIARASGCEIFDHDGKRLLDFSSQLVNTNIGHSHPKVVQAIKDQAETLATVAPQHAVLVRGEAAKRVLEKAGPKFSKVFFTNGGADANENAIRAARLFTGRNKVLSTYRSYHGNTGSSIVATGDWRRMPNEYATGHVHFFGPFAYRSEFWSGSEQEESQRALHHLERVIQSEGPQTIAALLLETIPGTAGVLVPPAGYLEGVRELCDRYGIVFIADEVMAGFGRTGHWFAHHAFGVTPDLITFAKGVNSGYVPVGGVIMTPEIATFFDATVFPGGLTYSGHPLAMASIIASIDAMEEEGIVDNAKMIGEKHLGPGLHELAKKHPIIGDVRGMGVFWALDLVGDPHTKSPLAADHMARLKGLLIDHGLLGFIAENRLHVVPPCVVTPEQVAEGLGILDRVFSELTR